MEGVQSYNIVHVKNFSRDDGTIEEKTIFINVLLPRHESLDVDNEGEDEKFAIEDIDNTNESAETDVQEATPTTNENAFLQVAKATSVAAGAGIAGAVAVPTAATAAMTAAGFTSAGIAGGSAAAAIQSSIGAVAAGSWFAGLQSVAATGGVAILGPIGIAAGVLVGSVAGVGYLGYRLSRSRRQRPAATVK